MNNISFYTYFKFLERNWVLGEKGEICDDVCEKSGRYCDYNKQSELITSTKIKNAMKHAGVSCSKTAGPRGYPGTPFYSKGTCVYLTDSAQSVCDKTRNNYHQPLCYCRGM